MAQKKKGVTQKDQGQSQKLPETEEGTVLFNVPLPRDPSSFNDLPPITVKWPYQIDYIHSYAQDSPFFAGLANGRLLGTRCPNCHYNYATPRGHCMHCGTRTEWFDLPLEGRVHTWTTCHFGSEAFLPETPFNLILVEFDGVDTLLLSRLVGVGQEDMRTGMKVQAKFRRNSKFDPTDVYFVPAGET
ncbi:MAG: Zn-ribbon domain-containing OB-fold protein [Nitrospinota bacterium]